MPKELGLEELRVLSEKATPGPWPVPSLGSPDVVLATMLVNAFRDGLLLPLSGMGKGMGAPPQAGSGSHASHSTPSGSRRPGFDPSRIAEAIEIARDAGKALVGVGMFGTVPGALQNAFGELAVAGAKAAIEALGIEARQGRGEDAVEDESPADLSATPTLPLPPRGRCQGWEPYSHKEFDPWEADRGEWTADIPMNADEGPAIAYADEDGCALGFVWWTNMGGGVSRITHWAPLSGPVATPPASPTPTEG